MTVLGNLRHYLPGGRRTLQGAAGRPLLEAAAALGIPPQLPLVALVNDRTVDLNHVLAPGDRVTLLPPIAGG